MICNADNAALSMHYTTSDCTGDVLQEDGPKNWCWSDAASPAIDCRDPPAVPAIDLEGQSCDTVWTDCSGCTSTGGFCGTPSGGIGEAGGNAATVVCGTQQCHAQCPTGEWWSSATQACEAPVGSNFCRNQASFNPRSLDSKGDVCGSKPADFAGLFHLDWASFSSDQCAQELDVGAGMNYSLALVLASFVGCCSDQQTACSAIGNFCEGETFDASAEYEDKEAFDHNKKSCASQPAEFGALFGIDDWGLVGADECSRVIDLGESAGSHPLAAFLSSRSACCSERRTVCSPPKPVCAAHVKVVCDGAGKAINSIYAATDTTCSGTATQSPAGDEAVAGWPEKVVDMVGRFNIGTCTSIGPSTDIMFELGDYTGIVTCVDSEGNNVAAGTAPLLGYNPAGGTDLPCTAAELSGPGATFAWAEVGDPDMSTCLCTPAQFLHATDIIPGGDDTGCCACKEPNPPCVDSQSWENGQGATCGTYKIENWCVDGGVVEDWTVGAFWNYPEQNCCICGGGRAPGAPVCEDTAGWLNPAGLGCADYVAEKFCARGSGVLETWAAGEDWANPEDNCCACGKA